MLRKLRSRLTYANVMATLGVFIALGGTAYAVNTVGSSDIIDGEVKSVDIGNNEIGSSDVKDNSINTFDVHSFIGADVVDGSLTAADLAISSVDSAEIRNFSVANVDIRNNSVETSVVEDGSLNDEDVGQTTLTDFSATIGVVPATTCVYRTVTGVSAGGDHLLLTADTTDAAVGLIYSAEYNPDGVDAARIKVCNPFAAGIDDATTHFNLLTFDAQ